LLSNKDCHNFPLLERLHEFWGRVRVQLNAAGQVELKL
jgi:hypothetical protein